MKYTVACILFLITCIACRKEYSDEYGPPPASLQDFFAKNRSDMQSFTLNNSSGGSLKGKKGSSTYFYPNSFVDINGKPINGNVQLQIFEVYTPGDMILNNLPTMADNNLLESGGELFIKATYNGAEAKLAPGAQYQVALPNKLTNRMKVFNGETNTDGKVNWKENTNTATNYISQDSMRTCCGFYSMFCDQLSWINCDRYPNEPKIDCKFLPGNCPDMDSTGVFVSLTGRNAVARVNFEGSRYPTEKVLVAASATLVGICIKNGKFYASIFNITLKDQASYTLNFQPVSEDKLRKQLGNLR